MAISREIDRRYQQLLLRQQQKQQHQQQQSQPLRARNVGNQEQATDDDGKDAADDASAVHLHGRLAFTAVGRVPPQPVARATGRVVAGAGGGERGYTAMAVGTGTGGDSGRSS